MEFLVKDLKKHYGKTPVLNGLCLQARSGECIGIAGENGSGKSTLLSLLAGALRPDGGSFLADGTDLFSSPRRLRALTGFAPQQPPLAEELSGKDHLLLFYGASRLKQEGREGLLKALELESFWHLTVKKMSGGMKKRLSVACALAHQPRLLLLDEPSAALDPKAKSILRSFLASYCAKGNTVILATHDREELALCSRLYLLENGRLAPCVFEGTGDLPLRRL